MVAELEINDPTLKLPQPTRGPGAGQALCWAVMPQVALISTGNPLPADAPGRAPKDCNPTAHGLRRQPSSRA